MDWLSKMLGVKSGQYRPQLARFAFGIIGLCVAFPAFAELALTDSIMADIAYANNMAELEAGPEVGAHFDVLTDLGLSAISGRGAEATKLESKDKFAVLLWDERGSGNKRPTGHDVDGGSGFQAVNSSINLTVNRR